MPKDVNFCGDKRSFFPSVSEFKKCRRFSSEKILMHFLQILIRIKTTKYLIDNYAYISTRTREASMQLSNGGHIRMASKSQICEFLHQDLNFGAFFIVLNMYFIFFITDSYKTMWRSGKHSCLGSRRPGFKSHYCQKSFFSFKS